MTFSEQADHSAEHTEAAALHTMDQLRAECLEYGSVAEYVRSLAAEYNVDDQRRNMLQLQRMAYILTNPKNDESFPRSLTNAFYWGEILAYRSQEELSPEEWATNSYELFNQNMQASTAQARQPSGKSMMEALEEIEAPFIHPGLDDLIIQWSGEITADEAQWYMILGFRHVIVQVTRQEMGYEPGFAKKDFEFTETEALFKEKFSVITEQQEFDLVEEVQAVSIDAVRDHIMESLADHIIAADEFYGGYTDQFEFFLNKSLRTDFEAMEDLKEGDIIYMEGNGVFVSYDHETESENIFLLGEGERLQGVARNVVIAPVPTASAIKAMRGEQIDVNATSATEDIDLMGVVLIIENPVIISPDGIPANHGDGQAACIVLNNSDMSLKKYLVDPL